MAVELAFDNVSLIPQSGFVSNVRSKRQFCSFVDSHYQESFSLNPHNPHRTKHSYLLRLLKCKNIFDSHILMVLLNTLQINC